MSLLFLGVLVSSVSLYFVKGSLAQKITEIQSMYDYLYHVHHKNHFKTMTHIAQSSYHLVHVYLTQYIFHNSKRIGKNLYEIEYTINCKPYRFLVKYKTGPSKYKKFLQSSGQDVSDRIFPFLGPNDDFHRIAYAPKDFGYETLTVEYLNGDVREFKVHDTIL